MGHYGRRNPLPVSAQGNERGNKLEEQGEQLLPGIPNHITFAQIVPNVPATAFNALSRVSPCWRQAIQSHEVYNARIRSHVTETYVVICHTHPDRVLNENTCEVVHGISLYSLKKKSFCQLPAIPHLRRGIPRACQCISLDGKLYVLGGKKEPDEFTNTTEIYDRGSAEVYMLDLAGQGEWKQCANMQKPRLNFGCGVLDGKIYVLGGTSEDKAVHVSEMYDPKANAWSTIKPMFALRSHHGVSTLGKELFVHGGYEYGPEDMVAEDETIVDGGDEILFLEVYHPGNNEWRIVGPSGLDSEVMGRLFVADGKFHYLRWNGVSALEMDEDRMEWTGLKDISFSPFGPSILGPSCIGPTVHTVEPSVAKAVNGDYLVLVDYYTNDAEDYKTCLVQSTVIGPEEFLPNFLGRKFEWEKVNCPLSFENLDTSFICPIEL